VAEIGKKLFCVDLDNVATRWLKNIGGGDPRAFVRDMDQARASAAEALLISPCATFRVMGENVVLAQLVTMFGPKAVADLLGEHAIDFVLWRSFVGTNAEPIDGMHLFAAGNIGDLQDDATAEQRVRQAVFTDPEASAEAGLASWLKTPLDRPTRRDLARAAAKRTVVTDKEVPGWAVNRVQTAYANGELEHLGLAPSRNLSLDEQKTMVRWAEHLAAAAILLENGYDLYEVPEFWDTLMMLYTRLVEREQARTVTEQILSFASCPSIPALLAERKDLIQEVPLLRKKRGTVEYREWLWSQPNVADANDVMTAYARGIVNKKSLADSRWFRPAHLLIGQTVSGAAAFTLGPAGFAAGEAAAIAFAVADDFIVAKLSRAHDPHRFTREVIGPIADRLEVVPVGDHDG